MDARGGLEDLVEQADGGRGENALETDLLRRVVQGKAQLAGPVQGFAAVPGPGGRGVRQPRRVQPVDQVGPGLQAVHETVSKHELRVHEVQPGRVSFQEQEAGFVHLTI